MVMSLNLASNGLSLLPGQQTILKFKFKKTVATDTQIVYKFSTTGTCFQKESEMIKITVNYKGGGATTPTAPKQNSIYAYASGISSYNGNYRMYEGQYPIITIYWSIFPGFSCEWQKKTKNGSWTTIPSATNYSLTVADISESTYFRLGIKNDVGAIFSFSNEIYFNVEKKLSNNEIYLSGSEVVGSFPSGGENGKFPRQRWLVYVLEGEDPWVFNEDYNNPSICNFSIPASVYIFMEPRNNIAYVRREVYTSTQSLISNAVLVTPLSDITNNVIALSDTGVLGSLPTGGTGSFRYNYYLYQYDDNGEILDVYDVGNDQNYSTNIYNNLVTKIYRKVTSGNKVSYSNTVTLLMKKVLEKMLL